MLNFIKINWLDYIVFYQVKKLVARSPGPPYATSQLGFLHFKFALLNCEIPRYYFYCHVKYYTPGNWSSKI